AALFQRPCGGLHRDRGGLARRGEHLERVARHRARAARLADSVRGRHQHGGTGFRRRRHLQGGSRRADARFDRRASGGLCPAGKGRQMMMNRAVLILSAFALGAGAAAAAPADLVLLDGKIHTEDAGRSVVQAMAVRGNAILAVGTDEAVRALAGPATRTVHLGGRVVLPGIIDAHTHPAQGSQDLGKCSLEDKEITPADLETRVAKCLAEHPGGKADWFEAVAVNPSGLKLSLADLDSILSDRPMLLSGSDGHTAWANSAALKLAHITAATKDPDGGHIERDAAGQP